MSLFLRLSGISLRRYCQKSVAMKRYSDKKGEMDKYGKVYRKGEFKPSADYGRDHHFYIQQQFNYESFHLFVCHLKELNGWIKNHIKTIPKI